MKATKGEKIRCGSEFGACNMDIAWRWVIRKGLQTVHWSVTLVTQPCYNTNKLAQMHAEANTWQRMVDRQMTKVLSNFRHAVTGANVDLGSQGWQSLLIRSVGLSVCLSHTAHFVSFVSLFHFKSIPVYVYPSLFCYTPQEVTPWINKQICHYT